MKMRELSIEELERLAADDTALEEERAQARFELQRRKQLEEDREEAERAATAEAERRAAALTEIAGETARIVKDIVATDGTIAQLLAVRARLFESMYALRFGKDLPLLDPDAEQAAFDRFLAAAADQNEELDLALVAQVPLAMNGVCRRYAETVLDARRRERATP